MLNVIEIYNTLDTITTGMARNVRERPFNPHPDFR
jgi:hypothetical protein